MIVYVLIVNEEISVYDNEMEVYETIDNLPAGSHYVLREYNTFIPCQYRIKETN